MSDVVIRVAGLSKRYRIGGPQAGRPNFRESLTDALTAPYRWLRRRGPAAPDDRTFWALKDISFEVKRGEVVGIIGRNGAGKSTLLKILSRITEPTEGSAELHGRVGSLLEVGTGFHPELTGRENIYLNGAILGMRRTEIARKFDEIVAFAETDKFLDTPVKYYSSGMYMRLAFAVAAHLEPEILIVDEVLAVGDAAFQKKCLGKMGEVAREGRTVMFVSHNMAAMELLTNTCILLAGGRVDVIGDKTKVITHYMSKCSSTSKHHLESRDAKHIRSFKLFDLRNEVRETYAIGETIVFDIALWSEAPICDPRLGIAFHSASGERIATIHTDIQQNKSWSILRETRLQAIWKNVPLNVGRYRIDIALWNFDTELESLIGAAFLEIDARDIYGTGSLPEPSYQGHLVPDASWQIPDLVQNP